MPEKLSLQTKINNSLQRDEETYELEKFKKNAMIIFNHDNFLALDSRRGTASDVAALEDTFKQFRFDVTTRNNLTRLNLADELERFSRKDFNDYGCICVAILTHGDDGFLMAFDTPYRERDAFSCFDALANPTLVGKPIIFLIQACRSPTAASENNSTPTKADMIIFQSSFFGRASFRNVKEGSWFIQTVCEQMKLHGSTHYLEELFLRVRQNVATLEYNGIKQMPVFNSTLLKNLYLKKIDETKITVNCNCIYVCADCRQHAHIAHNGGSAPDDTYNGGYSAPDDTYNGGSTPDDTYNGGSTPDDTNNGGSTPDDTYNGGFTSDDTHEETHNSNTENGSAIERIDGLNTARNVAKQGLIVAKQEIDGLNTSTARIVGKKGHILAEQESKTRIVAKQGLIVAKKESHVDYIMSKLSK